MKLKSLKSGSIVFVAVIGSLIIMSILGFALFRTMSERSYFVNAHSILILMDTAAKEVAEVVSSSISKSMSDTDSDLFKQLLEAEANFKPIAITGKDSEWKNSYAFTGQKEFAEIAPSVAAKFTFISLLDESGEWKDEREKQIQLDIDVNLTYGKLGFRAFSRNYHFSRICRIQCNSLPVISKFTLFIKTPAETDEKNEGYNCYSNFNYGSPSKSSQVLPIVLFNNPDVKSTDITESGYVFIGGKKDIQLHVTSGSDPNYGEYFQFFNINSSKKGTPVFTVNKLPSTSAFTSSVDISQDTGLKGKLGIQGAIFGFYTLDKSSPPNDMNFHNSLEKFFPSSKSRTMNSSFLHLFGNLKHISATVVLGNVYRVFPQYTYLTADLDNDGKYECTWSILRSPAEYQTTGGSTVDFWDTIRLPKMLYVKRSTDKYDLDGTLLLQSIFMTRLQYDAMASRLVTEEYNRAYEYLKDNSSKIPPEVDYKKMTGKEVLQTGENFKITKKSDSKTIFEGNLNNISSKNIISNRISVVVNDQNEFNQTYINNKKLNMFGQVVFIDGPITIPSGITIQTSGTIIANGDITISGNITRENDLSKATPILNLVTVKKNCSIVLSGINQQVYANLVALEGTVKISRSDNRAKIFGGIAVDTLSPDDWKSGAEINFATEGDPTLDNQKNYSFIMADFYDQWNGDKSL